MRIVIKDEASFSRAEVESEDDGTVWFWIEKTTFSGQGSFSAWFSKEYALKLAEALVEAAEGPEGN